MNIGDKVKVEMEMKINSIESDLFSDRIILSGPIQDGREGYLQVKAPLSSCTLIYAGVESVMRETFTNGK